MRDGYRIVDTDTHVQPAMEVLEEYASAELRERWSELDPYLRVNDEPRPDVGDWDRPSTNLSVAPYRYERTLGHKGEAELQKAGGATALEGRVTAYLEDGPEIGILHDNSEGRLRSMDREGVDCNLIIPGTFGNAATALDIGLARELSSAFNRYIVDYCAADPDRLKTTVLVQAGDPEWSARQVKELADERCVAAVTVCLPEDIPIDDPDLHPIWRAMDDADLPILHHSFFYEPPYFPGYRDIWDNVVVARGAAHPWGAQRLVAYLILSGLFDQFPNLRVGFAECGASWLPFWVRRLASQGEYMSSMIPDLKYHPVDYVARGHVYVGVELYEGPELVRSINDVFGDGVAMYQSDFPHPQCNFPDTPVDALGWNWDEVGDGDQSKRKFFSENAERYMRML